jgi:hypothetical protein
MIETRRDETMSDEIAKRAMIAALDLMEADDLSAAGGLTYAEAVDALYAVVSKHRDALRNAGGKR